MRWTRVADFLLTKRCFEAKKTGRCNCRAKIKNACGIAKSMAESAEQYALSLTADHSIAEIYRLVAWKRCGQSRGGKKCNHRGCIEAENCLLFLASLELLIPV